MKNYRQSKYKKGDLVALKKDYHGHVAFAETFIVVDPTKHGKERKIFVKDVEDLQLEFPTKYLTLIKRYKEPTHT